MRLIVVRAFAASVMSGLQLVLQAMRCFVSISNEATVSGKACRLAPVAIGELILSELYSARRVRSRPCVWLQDLEESSWFLIARQRTDN